MIIKWDENSNLDGSTQVSQFNLLVYEQGSTKDTESVGRQNKILSSQFLVSIKKKEEETVIVSVQSIYSLCNIHEEIQIIFFYYCVIILGFPFVNCLNILQMNNEIKH